VIASFGVVLRVGAVVVPAAFRGVCRCEDLLFFESKGNMPPSKSLPKASIWSKMVRFSDSCDDLFWAMATEALPSIPKMRRPTAAL